MAATPRARRRGPTKRRAWRRLLAKLDRLATEFHRESRGPLDMDFAAMHAVLAVLGALAALRGTSRDGWSAFLTHAPADPESPRTARLALTLLPKIE